MFVTKPFAMLPITALLASGCQPDAGGAAFVARDSAGVRVVASARPLWRSGEGWRVDSIAVAELRPDASGNPREVAAALLLPSGQVVVGDAGTQALRWYDVHGRLLRTIDRTSGGGFVSLSALSHLDGGGVLAWDAGSASAAAFDADGRPLPASSAPGADDEAIGTVLGAFGDGTLLGEGEKSSTFVVSPLPRRERAALLRVSYAPARIDTVGSVAGPEELTWGDETSALRLQMPFARRTRVAVRGNRFWTADSDRPEVRVWSRDGRLLQVARAATAPRSIDARERRRAQAMLAARARGDLSPAAADSLLAHLPIPETWPAFAELRVDAEGAVWLRGAAPDEARRWTVFAADGRLLGTVLLPPGLELLDVGRDRILGIWRDAHGDPHLRLHRLRR
jgi:hypothetical protein